MDRSIARVAAASWGAPGWWLKQDAGMQLKILREYRRVSLRQLADDAGVNPSVVSRLEKGGEARLATLIKLYAGLGYTLVLLPRPQCEEAQDLLDEEADRRRQRRADGLASAKGRFRY
jgi:transcriptional regulator with XRE-family HTH domain